MRPKVHIKWSEPFAYRKNAGQRDWTKKRLLRTLAIGAIYSVALLIVWTLANANPSKNPPPAHIAIPLALVGGPFLYFIISAAKDWCPRNVAIMNEKIIWTTYRPGGVLKRENVANVTLQNQIVDNRSFLTVTIRMLNDDEHVFGIPDKICRGTVSEAFERAQYPVMDHTQLRSRQ